MIALPGDTPDKSRYTAERIAELAPDFVRIYPTAVLKGTQLARLWEQGAYQPLSLIHICLELCCV